MMPWSAADEHQDTEVPALEPVQSEEEVVARVTVTVRLTAADQSSCPAYDCPGCCSAHCCCLGLLTVPVAADGTGEMIAAVAAADLRVPTTSAVEPTLDCGL